MMERSSYYLLQCLCIVICATVACTREVYVRPSSAVVCPSLTCYTLEHILQNPSQYLVSNMTIFFVAGVYNISTEGQVPITNVSNLAFIGSARVGNWQSRIQCTNAFGLAFINCSNISLLHLSIEKCGALFTGDALQRIEKHLPHNTFMTNGVISAALGFVQVSSLRISVVSVIAPKGHGLWATNVFNSNITESTFSNSSSGNLQLYYTDSDLVRVDNQFYFKIASSQFVHGTCNFSKQYGCGLSVVLLQLSYSIDIQISDITASNNWAWNGANIFMYGNGCTESAFRIENTVSMYGRGNRGTGLLFQWGSQTEPPVCTMRALLYAGPVLSIAGSQIIRNTANQGLVEISISLNPSIKVNTNYCTLIFRNSSVSFNRVTNFNSTTALLNFTGCETALFKDVTISHNSYNATASIKDQGWNQVILGVYNSNGRQLLFTCYNCNFSYNTNSTVFQLLNSISSVYFQGITTFTKNSNFGGEIVYIYASTLFFNGTTTFIGNGGPGIEASLYSTLYFIGNTTFKRFFINENGAAVRASLCNLHFYGNTRFEGNEAKSAGGAIALRLSTTVYATGNLTFVNNKAKFGGAMLVLESQIYMITPTEMNFSYNTASLYGGGIYVFVSDPLEFHQCFMQFTSTITIDNFQVTFTYNKAGIAGSALYGEAFDTCVTTFNPHSNKTSYPGFPGTVIEKLFQFESNKSDLSVVSSEPGRVCICEDNEPQCQIVDFNTTVYPGEEFTLSLIGVGQMLGAVPATVQAELSSDIRDEDSHSLGEFQNVQLILEPTCTAINYTVFSSNSKEELVLKVAPKRPPLDPFFGNVMELAANVYRFRHHSVNINLTLAGCPPGFTLSIYPFQCTCTPTLIKAGILCDINTKLIIKPQNYWIGAVVNRNGTNDAVVHPHCPYDYCKPGSIGLNLEYPDDQCQYNRSSTLCGNCKNSFSFVLGTSKCLQCSNIYLLLIGPFALAGIALVVILISCNFTVSVGTINGLIFYANIVRTNQAIFFPATVNGIYGDILTTFIAWLNLDLGIETCIWDGLDAYGKVWLQLIFPVYIWALIGAIIVLSDRYTAVARLSGRNAVPVLATLFHLSYAKLLRVVVTALSYTTLVYPDGTILTVWLYDGNVRYLEGKHIPLFLVALAILLFLSVPYTVVLVFAQCLQQQSSYRALFWVRKMKPLFDSYIGSYKDKHRYWTGLLLVARAVLILVYALTSLGDPAVNLLSTISVVTGLTVVNLAIGGAYKNWILTLLEQSFLLNLCILSAATQYTRQGGGNQVAVAYISVTVSLATSAGIFLYHMLIALRKCRCLKRSQTRPVTMVNIVQEELSSDSDPEEIKPPHKSQVLLFDEFREPVLEYCNDD